MSIEEDKPNVFYFLFLSPLNHKHSLCHIKVQDFFSISVSKMIFVNLLNSGVVTKLVVSGILFSIYVTFLSNTDLLTKLQVPGILFSIFVIFISKLVLSTKSVILESRIKYVKQSKEIQ